MNRARQILAAFLSIAMLFTMNETSVLAFQQTPRETVAQDLPAESTENTEESGNIFSELEDTGIDSGTEVPSVPEDAGISDTETIDVDTETADTEIETPDTETEDTETAARQQSVREKMLLSYLVFGSSYIETPAEQYVLLGIGDGSCRLEQAILHYKNNTTGKEYTVEADTLDTDAALFYMDFPDESYAGNYEVTAVDYLAEGVSGTIQIADTGIDAAFGVNQTVDTKPDAVTVDETQIEDAASTLITDAEGNVLSDHDLQEVISNAQRSVGNSGAVRSTGAGNLVVVLDPGHGGTDPGAVRTINGITYSERDLVLKIAQYCKAELETYNGVTVYMTRTNNTSPVESRQARVNKAAKWNADILVSFHLNSTGNDIDSANGAAVYIPNSNYSNGYDYNGIGKALGNKILEQLKKLGLKNNGTMLDEGGNGTYADGSVADNLGINYWSKYYQYKFAGILIEHAFINNYNDVVFHLSSEAKLKELGVADATGIASYYGLTKESTLTAPSLSYITSASSDSLKLAWSAVSGAAGYQIYRSENEKSGFKKVATVTSGSITTYTDGSLMAGTQYYYKIRAYSGSLTSNYSPVTGALPLAGGKITSVKSDGSGKITVKWNTVANASGYQLYRSTSKDGKYTMVANIEAATYTDAVSKGTTYYYKVRAKSVQNGKTGFGSYSEIAEGFSIAATTIKAVSAQSNGKLLIQWKAVKNAYRYQVYRSTSKNGAYTRIATVSGTSYEDGSIKTNQNYYYKVRTMNRVNKVSGYGSYSGVKYGLQVGKASITAIQTTSSTSLKITWKKVSNAAGYKVYRSSTKKGTYKLIKTITNGNTTSYKNSKLKTGQTYYYKVQAVGKTGGYTGEGKLSNVKSGKTVLKTSVEYVQSASGTKLKLAWQPVSDAAGYRIARSTSKTGKYTVVKEISSGKTSTFTDADVKAGKTYYYKVAVKNKNNGVTGYSEYSDVLGGKAAGATEMEAPKSASSASIELNWKAASGASGYQIYRSTEKKKGYSKIATISSRKTVTYKDTPPKTNTTYYYKIRCFNKNNGKVGYSGYCPPVSGKSLAVPKMNAVAQNADASLKISWKKVSGAASYRVYRRAGTTGSYQKLAEVQSTAASYQDTSAIAGVTYYYKVIAYNKVNGQTGNSGFSEAKSYMIELYEIMGNPGVTEAQMVSYYNSMIASMQLAAPFNGYGYPSDIYADKGAKDIDTFVKILYEEAVAEGVKPEVVFAQMCNETYFLQFDGDVKVEQCNFAGIGATGGGVPGNTFADVRTGIRAQVQHLKAYASTAKLTQACVDPRFQYVKRGTCKYVEWLGIQENPNTKWNADGTIASGCGWATAKNYGYILLNGINKIKKF